MVHTFPEMSAHLGACASSVWNRCESDSSNMEHTEQEVNCPNQNSFHSEHSRNIGFFSNKVGCCLGMIKYVANHLIEVENPVKYNSDMELGSNRSLESHW